MKVDIQTDSDVSIVRPAGKLDALTSPKFQESLDRILNDGVQRIVIDMSQIEYVSSAGLRVFVIIAKRLMANGQLIVAACAPSVKQVFELAGFPILMTICDDVTEAKSLA